MGIFPISPCSGEGSLQAKGLPENPTQKKFIKKNGRGMLLSTPRPTRRGKQPHSGCLFGETATQWGLPEHHVAVCAPRRLLTVLSVHLAALTVLSSRHSLLEMCVSPQPGCEVGLLLPDTRGMEHCSRVLAGSSFLSPSASLFVPRNNFSLVQTSFCLV